VTNRILSAALALIFFAPYPIHATKENRILSGKIVSTVPIRKSIVIHLFRLDVSASGKVSLLTKSDLLGGKQPFRTLQIQKPGDFSFRGLPPGVYSVIAFEDTDANGNITFDPPEAFGWYNRLDGSRFSAIDLRGGNNKEPVRIVLRRPVPFPHREKETEHGRLKWINGLPVLQLWGTPEERGYAHGYLVARQIVDFFEFYILEDSWRSPERYERIFVPFLEKNLNVPREFLKECRAVLRGMRDSGADLFVDLLGREFTLTDLLAINAYIERRAAFPGKPSSCTQFAFWGKATQHGPLGGGLVAARNMDGECDIRKVTVSHFLLFAVTPAAPDKKRWVSAMWPGFVGTISGINEDGLYSMENAGGSGPGPVPARVTPCSWIQRYILENAGADAGPEQILAMMKSFACSEGGITAAGSIILWARPYTGQKIPAFIFEGGRNGSAIRFPGQVRPFNPFVLMASNHHKLFGYDPEHPDYSLGLPISFSSRWRYEAGMNMLEAWSRIGKTLTVDDAKRLLQTVAHGTTEYSVIFLANEMKILVAVDDLKPDMWDAPYLEWKEFHFEDLFR
jgi:hypothetical protein